MTTNNKTCETDLDIKTNESAVIDKIDDFYTKLQILNMYDFMPDCPKPCITMEIKLKTLSTGIKPESSNVWVWRSKQVLILILHINCTVYFL